MFETKTENTATANQTAENDTLKIKDNNGTLQNNTTTQSVPLSESVRVAVRNYYNNLDGQEPKNLYKLVWEEVCLPLFQETMMRTRFNQSRAARWLGISRGTLRKCLKSFGLLDDNVKS